MKQRGANAMSRRYGAIVALFLSGLTTSSAGAASVDPGSPPQGIQSSWSLETLQRGGILSQLEYGTARSDHAEVAQAVARCDDNFDNPVSWSPSTRAVLLFELNDTLGHGVLRLAENENLRDILHLTFFQKAAISFSDKLSRDRLAFRYDMDNSHWWSVKLQIAAVVLGALATISIGIRSVIERDNGFVAWFAAFAIASSALSTAVATLNTFGNFQTVELRSSKTLAQLQQLHWRVVSDVVKNSLICAKGPAFEADQTSQVNSWRDRYEIIRDAAVDSLARPGDVGSQAPGALGDAAAGKAGRKAAPSAATPIDSAPTQTSQQ